MQQLQFILFLDPKSQQFYSFCEQKGILVRQKIPQKYRDLIKDDIHQFNKIMKWDKKQTIYNDSSFQKRPIPVGYLTPRKFRFPTYSCEQPIKEATLEQIRLNDDGFLVKGQYLQNIKARIYLGSIRDQVQNAKKVYTKLNTQYIESTDIRLITSANQVIRTICRNILQQYKIVITTKSQRTRLILKVKNRDEYMFGNEPISHYKYVLECLKNQKMMEIQIIQTQINLEREQFQKFIFYRKIANIQNLYYQPINWDEIMKTHTGFFLWYQPDIFYLDPVIFQKKSPEQLMRAKQRIQNQISENHKSLRMKIPRYILKENIQTFIEQRRKEIQKKLVSLDGSTIFSGQCNFGYSFKISGITNLFSLFVLKNPQNKISKKNLLKLTSSKQSGENIPKHLSTSYSRYNDGLNFKKSGFPFIPYQVDIIAEFYHNGQILYEQAIPIHLITNIISMDGIIKWKYRLCDLMLQTSIIFKVRVHSKDGQNIICGVGVLKLFDEYGFLKQGQFEVQMYGHEKIQIVKLGCYHNKFGSSPKLTSIFVKLPKFRKPVRWTLNDPYCMQLLGYCQKKPKQSQINIEEKMAELTRLLNLNPLQMLKYTNEQKQLLREGRKYYKHLSNRLINYLYSIQWHNSLQIAEAYQALRQWAPLKPIQGLFLLSPRLVDEKIRFFAVKTLQKMKNYQFCLYSNQITQALVSFQTLDNPLIDLIIERSSLDPFTVGQQYFWQFWNRKDQYITEFRFNLYLQTLILTSPIRKTFFNQIRTYKALILANAELVRQTKDMYFYQKDEHFKTKCKKIEQDLLKIDSQGFSFPIRPQMKFKYLVQDQCKMFDSKKLPFSLCCCQSLKAVRQKKQKPYKVMFKCGDDIKQDNLILQILLIFDKLWVQAGYDLKMNIYRTLSTQTEIGFIQIVDDAQNSSKIHKDHSQKIMEALDDQSTLLYLKKHNPVQRDLTIAKQNFIRSSAAYLVATYILGIGDRHSGNYMVQKNGKFFHIDFGHILGNFKYKMGIKRERTPFVFTSQYAFVMDGSKSKHFARFERYCSIAYNILRKNANLIINMMALMVGAEIPQLQKLSDVEYMVQKLNLQMSQLQAEEHLIKQIKKTLDSQSRKYDNFFHEKMRFG